MSVFGMALLTAFALAAGLCLWLYWRERQEHRRTRREIVVLIGRSWMDRVKTVSGSSIDADGWIRCSHCDAKVRPHGEIATSGWTQYGWIGSSLDALDGVTMTACPECWPTIEGMYR